MGLYLVYQTKELKKLGLITKRPVLSIEEAEKYFNEFKDNIVTSYIEKFENNISTNLKDLKNV